MLISVSEMFLLQQKTWPSILEFYVELTGQYL